MDGDAAVLPLPKFGRPPVDEVVVGIHFNAAGFKPIHFGLFYEKIRHSFPKTEERPFLPPPNDFGDADSQQPVFAFNPFSSFGPRVIFISEDSESLIQLQNDRLYFNWRRLSAEAKYKHYEHVRNGFAAAFQEFSNFASEYDIGPIAVTSCEVDYVNLITATNSGSLPSRPQDVFSVWSGKLGAEWDGDLEDLSFNARYHLADQKGNRKGRLTSTLSTVPNTLNEMIMRLELVARGRPESSSLEDILAFHDIGHAAIVRCFAAMTTEKMHNVWNLLR